MSESTRATVEVEIGDVKIASIALLFRGADCWGWYIDCHTKRPEVCTFSGGEEGEGVFLMPSDAELKELTTVTLKHDLGGDVLILAAASRYSVYVFAIKRATHDAMDEIWKDES